MRPMSPMHDQPEHGTDGTPARQLSKTEFVAQLGALITELESAEGGSQSLDVRIHHGFRVLGGFGEDMASLLIKEGVSWPTVQATLNEIVPAYSTSLDAALQGEDIVFSIRSAKARRWGAMQRTASGGEELAWAATEPLARRLAALKSWRAELKKSLDDDETHANQISGQTPIYQAGPNQAARKEIDKTGAKHWTGNEQSTPDHDVTRLHDAVKDAENEISDQEEKDWKILF